MLEKSAVHLNVAGQTIRTTADHPFHLTGKGWINAADLQPGDLLDTADRKAVPVLWVMTETSAKPFPPMRSALMYPFLDGALPAGTMLLTTKGLKKVEDIVPGDHVLGPDPQGPERN